MKYLCGAIAFGILLGQEPPVFRAENNSVPVTVVVRDKEGHAVGNLTAESFKLFDSGKEQVIAKFEIEKTEPHPLTQTITGNPAAPQNAPVPPVAPDRFVAYLFDDIHLMPADLIQVRLAAGRHLAKLGPTERASIYTTSGNVFLGFTTNRESINKALSLIQPMGNASADMMQCPPLTYYSADMIDTRNDSNALDVAEKDAAVCANLILPRDIKRAESLAKNVARMTVAMGVRDTLASMDSTRNLVQNMAKLPGTRAIVLISPGFVVSLRTSQALNNLIEQAVRANIVISSLNARGLFTENAAGDASKHITNPSTMLENFRFQQSASVAASGTLGELAYGTGGKLTENNNDMDEGLRRASTAPEFLYVLSFSPANLKFDGRYHGLKVTLTDPRGYSLQVRKGYYAPVPVKGK